MAIRIKNATMGSMISSSTPPLTLDTFPYIRKSAPSVYIDTNSAGSNTSTFWSRFDDVGEYVLINVDTLTTVTDVSGWGKLGGLVLPAGNATTTSIYIKLTIDGAESELTLDNPYTVSQQRCVFGDFPLANEGTSNLFILDSGQFASSPSFFNGIEFKESLKVEMQINGAMIESTEYKKGGALFWLQGRVL